MASEIHTDVRHGQRLRLFRTRSELEEQEGAYPIGLNRFASPAGEWVPLYEGKMVQAFDHRAASIVIADKNLHRSAKVGRPQMLSMQLLNFCRSLGTMS